jgi:exopolysaccharide production protein ExoQ
MNVYNSRWPLTESYKARAASVPFALRRKTIENPVDPPVSQQILTWLLIWPILTMIAQQPVYFGGAARTAAAYQNGAAASGARGSHSSLYIYLLFLLVFVLAGNRQIWIKLKRNPLVPALLVLALISAFWSPTPMVTLQMCIEVGLCTLFACYLSARYTTERLMQLLVFMGVVSALLSIFFALALPAYGIFQGYAGGAWEGICGHKNALGVGMAFLLTPIFFITNVYSRERKLMYIALLLFLIYKSQSRGAWFDTAGMLLFVGCLSLIRRIRHRELTFVLFVMTTASLAVVGLAVYFWPLLATHMGKSATMSGRTAIYAEVWRSIIKHPVLGYGFGGFWSPESLEARRIGLAIGWTNIGYAESGILEVALQIGSVGVGLLMAMIAAAVLQGVRLLRSSQYSPRVGWFLTVLFLAALTNIDAGQFMTSDKIDWVLILLSCMGLKEEALRVRPPAFG